MARSGRFGRRPRTGGGNLSQLIAALMAQHQAAQDKDIFDAYNNGGLFEGQPVTDQRLLDYITKRRDSFPTNDPLWDQWNNTLIQQKFTIGEQKIGLAYKQGKATARDVANFYKSQLQSIPQDSAFYREVAGRAAEWAKAARQGSGGGGGGGGGQSAYKTAQAAGNTLQDTIAAWTYADYAVRDALQREGYSLSPNDPIWAVGADIITSLFNQGKVIGPGGGIITLEAYQQTATANSAAYQSAITAYKAAGQNYVTLIKQKNAFDSEVTTKISSLPYQVRAEAVYDNLNTALDNAQGDPKAIADAYAAAQRGITAIVNDAKQAGADAEIVSFLNNDITTLGGGDAKGGSMLDLILQQNAATGQTPWKFLEPASGMTTSESLKADVTTTTDQQKLLATGKGYLVQDGPGGALTVVDRTTQPESTLDPSLQSTVIMVNGVPTKVYLQGTPVVANASYVKDSNGNITVQSNANPRTGNPDFAGQPEVTVGYKFTYTTPGGQNIEGWGVYTASGLKFTTQDPFAGQTTIVSGKNGNIIVVAPPEVAGQAINIDSITRPSVMAGATSSLQIDPAATQYVTSNTERAYQLYTDGIIDAQTFVQIAAPKAAAGMTPEEALAQVRQQKADSDAALIALRASERNDAYGIQTPTSTSPVAIAQDILNRLGISTSPQAQTQVGAPPAYGPIAPVSFDPVAFRASEKSLANPNAPGAPGSPYAGPPVPTDTSAPSVPASSSTYTAPKLSPIGPTTVVSKPIVQPTTTTVSSGRYTGKIIPL